LQGAVLRTQFGESVQKNLNKQRKSTVFMHQSGPCPTTSSVASHVCVTLIDCGRKQAADITDDATEHARDALPWLSEKRVAA